MVAMMVGGTAPLLLFSLLLFLQIVLRFLPSRSSPKKRMSAQEAELVRQIKQLNREADALNTPATFAKSSKLRRAAVAKEKELAALKQPSGGGDYGWLATKLSVSFVIKVIVILGVGGWFRQIHVASVPASLLQPFGNAVKLPAPVWSDILAALSKRECKWKTSPGNASRPGGRRGMLAVKGGDSDMVNVSVMPWMLLSTTVSSYLVNNIWHRA